MEKNVVIDFRQFNTRCKKDKIALLPVDEVEIDLQDRVHFDHSTQLLLKHFKHWWQEQRSHLEK